MLRRVNQLVSSTAAAVAAPSCCSHEAASSDCCQKRFISGPQRNTRVRSQHNKDWFAKSKNHMLTGKAQNDTLDRPPFPGFAEDVDRPIVMPKNCSCFACGANMNAIAGKNMMDIVWVTSGNAAVPTPQGYFFCRKCFKCAKCKFRFMHNSFYTVKGEAVCLRCAMGRDVQVPMRRWHSSFVQGYNTSSRLSGQAFPRFKHQLEFLYSPEK